MYQFIILGEFFHRLGNFTHYIRHKLCLILNMQEYSYKIVLYTMYSYMSITKLTGILSPLLCDYD